MKLAWLSDIHLDHADTTAVGTLVEEGVRCGAEVFCLSGDISHSERIKDDLESLSAALGGRLFFVLGNHDYFYSSWERTTAEVREWCETNRRAIWLTHHPFVSLAPGIALVGHDGWADGRLGEFESIWRQIQDYYLIEDLSNQFWEDCLGRMRAFADRAASHLEEVITNALRSHEIVLVLTHVPPFRKLAHRAGEGSDDWLPHYCCATVGECLIRIMRTRPEQAAIVLCGHTHFEGKALVLPNLVCLSAAAEYGRPRLQGVYDLSVPLLRAVITP